jgi:hypothetical protein
MKRIAIAVCAVVLVLAVAPWAQTTAPKPDPALKKFDVFLGHFQLKETEGTPDKDVLKSSVGQNRSTDRSIQPGLSNRPSFRSHDDLIEFSDAARNASTSAKGPLGGDDTETNRIKTQRLISGLGLAVSWGGTVIVDLLEQDGYRGSTLIPVIGPWITLARMARNHDSGWPGAKALLVVSGLAQTGFATFFIISLTSHPKPKETKNLAISAGLNSINLKIQF